MIFFLKNYEKFLTSRRTFSHRESRRNRRERLAVEGLQIFRQNRLTQQVHSSECARQRHGPSSQ